MRDSWLPLPQLVFEAGFINSFEKPNPQLF